jgi:hypothetical protein
MLLAPPCSHIWLARHSIYDTLDGYRQFACAEDYDFLLRAISAGFRVSNLPDPLMLVRNRPGNLSSRLEQKKCHHYIVRLYRERLKGGQDSFSVDAYKRVVMAGPLEHSAYLLAVKLGREGLRSHHPISRIVLLVVSALISPWQGRYFLSRIRFRVAMRTSVRAF